MYRPVCTVLAIQGRDLDGVEVSTLKDLDSNLWSAEVLSAPMSYKLVYVSARKQASIPGKE
jgi:hypothetical protein